MKPFVTISDAERWLRCQYPCCVLVQSVGKLSTKRILITMEGAKILGEHKN